MKRNRRERKTYRLTVYGVPYGQSYTRKQVVEMCDKLAHCVHGIGFEEVA